MRIYCEVCLLSTLLGLQLGALFVWKKAAVEQISLARAQSLDEILRDGVILPHRAYLYGRIE